MQGAGIRNIKMVHSKTFKIKMSELIGAKYRKVLKVSNL
jgi:hypothetical protein